MVGAVLLIVSAFVGWYQVSSVGPGYSDTITLLPGNSESTTCTTNTASSANCPGGTSGSITATYSSQMMNHTGQLYQIVQFLCIAAFVTGLIGGVLALIRMPSRPGLPRSGLALVAVGALLGSVGPLWVAVGQPGALSADTSSPPPSGPWATFSGSDTFGATSVTWGPWLGWYFAIAGAIALIVASTLIGLQLRASGLSRPNQSSPTAAVPGAESSQTTGNSTPPG